MNTWAACYVVQFDNRQKQMHFFLSKRCFTVSYSLIRYLIKSLAVRTEDGGGTRRTTTGTDVF